MTDNSVRLLELADACEKASARMQPKLLVEAFELIKGPMKVESRPGLWRWNDDWFPFNGLIKAGAYHSAAEFLVPRPASFGAFCGGFSCEATVSLCDAEVFRSTAESAALALTAALARALAARAAQVSAS